MARKNVKVKIPISKPDVFLAQGEVLDKKNIELGEGSPLKPFNMVEYHDKLLEAIDYRAQAKALRAQSESLMQRANTIIGVADGQTSEIEGTLYYFMTMFRDQLLITYRGNEEELEVWGFDVVVSSNVSHPPTEPPVEE